MFFPEGQIRVHVYGRPVDMRKSYDGLYALTRQEPRQDPLNDQSCEHGGMLHQGLARYVMPTFSVEFKQVAFNQFDIA